MIFFLSFSTASDSRSVITDRRTTTDLAFGSGANIIQHTRIDPPRIDPPRVDPPRMGKNSIEKMLFSLLYDVIIY